MYVKLIKPSPTLLYKNNDIFKIINYNIRALMKPFADLAEWSMAPSWKGGVVQATKSSNPLVCAIKKKVIVINDFSFFNTWRINRKHWLSLFLHHRTGQTLAFCLYQYKPIHQHHLVPLV